MTDHNAQLAAVEADRQAELNCHFRAMDELDTRREAIRAACPHPSKQRTWGLDRGWARAGCGGLGGET